MAITLIVAAHPSEFDGLESIAKSNGNIQITYCGVGLFEAMFNLQKFLSEREKPAQILLMGSAGCYHKNYIHTIFACNRFQMPLYKTEEIPELVKTEFTTVSGLAKPDVITYSTFGVSVVGAPVRNVSEKSDTKKTYLENMEAAGLAFVCQKMGIGFTALLVATNTISADSRTQWKQNFKQAGRLLMAELEKILPEITRLP